MCLKTGQSAGIVTADDRFHAIVAPAADLTAHTGRMIRVTGTLHTGAVRASKAEISNNGTYREVKLSGVL